MLRRSTLVVLFLFVVLLGIAVYLQRNPLPKTDESLSTPTPAPSLFSVGAEAIVSFGVESGDQKSVMLRRVEGNGWELTSPIQDVADAGKVDSGLSQFSSVKILRQLDPVPALSAMGLDAPMYKISLMLDDNRTLIVEVGSETPTGSGYYLRLDGGAPVVVSKYSVDTIIGFLENPPVLPTPTPTEAASSTPEATDQPSLDVLATATP